MTSGSPTPPSPTTGVDRSGAALSLYHLLDPEVLANPYPLFHRLRREDPVHWDSYLHAWVVTRYPDVLQVLHDFAAARTPTPEQLAEMGLAQLKPIAQLMVKQMLFMDASAHVRLRGLASKAFTPARVETLKSHIADIVNRLLDEVQAKGRMDVIADFADPLPAIVTAELLGVPVSDHKQLKAWSANFAEMLGNFQHNPDHAQLMLRTVEDMTSYFLQAVREIKAHPREGLIHSLLTAEVDGDRLTEEEVVANTIVTMVGGQETTTNLIGNGLLTLLRNPEEMERLRGDMSLIPPAVEEMLRYESPSQHTARLAPADVELGGKLIRKRQAVIAVMAAANRDPERFPDPDRFDITRADNRHVAFGYAAHFCFGAPLARAEGQIAFQAMLQRLTNLHLEPQRLTWRTNLGLRGLTALHVSFGDAAKAGPGSGSNEREARAIAAQPQAGAAAHDSIPLSNQCLHQLFEAQAERTPDALALEHGNERLSYRELNEQANQLAHYLRGMGAGPDTPIGVCLPPAIPFVVALLAVLKSGGACLPLDPEYPTDRLQFMLEDTKAPVLITNEALRSRLNCDRAGTRMLSVDSERDAIGKQIQSNPDRSIAPANLAYVIYTSGSTGKPRGVLLPHAGLVNHGLVSVRLYGLTPSDRVLQFSSISFDIAIEEIWPTFMAGAAVVLRAPDFSLAAADFLRRSREQGVTVFDLPTAYWHELVQALVEGAGTLPASLRLVIVGGEKASAPLLKTWRAHTGASVRWINTYGPTEASVIATAYEPPAGEVPDPLPIGKPISNVRTYILDGNLQPVPVGVEGELHIGGVGVARGYLNRPELTTEKFVPDPFSSGAFSGNSFSDNPGARMYKTGDMARYGANGEIEFLGRRDFQVKIRGFRVELGEIEAALARHPGIGNVAVIARENGSSKQLAACFVPAPGQSPAISELRAFLKNQLPEYMVPSEFIRLQELPLTPNGKVDRKALAALAPEKESSDDYVPPSDPVQSRLAAIWEEILGKRPVGVRDNFFELGGHSLLALRLMRRIERAFERTLPLAALFEAPTIEQLAVVLDQQVSTVGTSLLVPIQPLGKRPVFFCVHGLGGAVLRFAELARHMAPDQPFYGIQPQGINGDAPVLDDVGQMAARYIRELRKFQPEGPYYIGGYSFGGLVAFEMARQLKKDGAEIGLVALLDTYPGKVKSKAVLLGTLLGLPLEQQVAYVKGRLKRYRRGLRRRFDSLFYPESLKQVHRSLARAEVRYQPEAYEGTVTWFRASEKALRGLDRPESDWSNWASGGVEIHEIDGDHGAILKEPMVRIFAQELRAALDEAQRQQPAKTRATPIETQTLSGQAGAVPVFTST